MTAIKTLAISLVSFGVGLAVLYGLYFFLGQALGEDLTGQEEVVLKSGYVAIAVIWVVVTVGLAYLFAQLARVSTAWTLLLIFFMIGLAAVPLLALTSYANDCRWALEWPLRIAGCD